ncbi:MULTISPECIES: hypothetical protein [unclassified Streptomyces]|uniref:hypothetical protein n=1 Tax=unclassified Streptomyces TaxID=2593676 RepID=UPI0034264CD9
MRSTRARSLAVATVAAGLLAGGITAGTDVFGGDKPADTIANAAAEESQNQARTAKKPPCIGEKKIANKKFVKTVYEWPDDPAHVQSMPGPAKTTWEYKVDLTSKVSATFGMSYKVINAGLGFEINKTQTVSKKVELNLKDKTHYLVRAGKVYKQYQFDVYEQQADFAWVTSTAARCKAYTWVKIGSGTALRPWTDTYRVTKVSKPKNPSGTAQQSLGLTQ